LSAGLPGRDIQATHCRNADADPDESGTPGPLRLIKGFKGSREDLDKKLADPDFI
jgi:hypothetical protein